MKTPLMGMFGLAALTLIAVLLLRQDLTLPQAAVRAVAVLAAVLVVERVLLPVARLLVGDPASRGSDDPDV